MDFTTFVEYLHDLYLLKGRQTTLDRYIHEDQGVGVPHGAQN